MPIVVSPNVAYFSPDLAQIADECFERAGVAAKAIGTDHIDSFLRSLILMLNSEWLNLGIRTYQFQQLSFTTSVVVGATVTAPAGVITVSDAILRRDGRDTPINPMSRSEYLEIPDKTQQGRPDRYLVDRQFNQVQFTLWRSPENNTDQVFYWAMCNTQFPGDDLTQNLQTRPEMLEALHAGMAAKMAMKFNIERYKLLQAYYCGDNTSNPRLVGGQLALALDSNRDWGDVRFTLFRNKRGRW